MKRGCPEGFRQPEKNTRGTGVFLIYEIIRGVLLLYPGQTEINPVCVKNYCRLLW